MSIDDAIKNLEAAKANGVKDIVLAYWNAEAFQMKEDDEEWAALAEYLEDQMDWSHTHEDLLFHKDNGI